MKENLNKVFFTGEQTFTVIATLHHLHILQRFALVHVQGKTNLTLYHTPQHFIDPRKRTFIEKGENAGSQNFFLFPKNFKPSFLFVN